MFSDIKFSVLRFFVIQFVAERDSCERIVQKPVYEVSTAAGKLWPVVIVEQVKYLHGITGMSGMNLSMCVCR